MKGLSFIVAVALHLSCALSQNLQGSETAMEERRLDIPMKDAPGEVELSATFPRENRDIFGPAVRGFCRSPGGRHGHYETYYGLSPDDCMFKCDEYNTMNTPGVGAACTAIEYNRRSKKCEIHFERIASVAPSDGEVYCVGADDKGCVIGSYFDIYFSRGNPGFSLCRVGRTKGEYKICSTCDTLYKCFDKCRNDNECAAFEFSEIGGGRCELHSKRPTGVAKTKKKAFCYVARSEYFDFCA